MPDSAAATVRFFVSGGEAKKLGFASDSNIWQKLPFDDGQPLPWIETSQSPGAFAPLRICENASAPPLVPKLGPLKSLWK